MILEFVGKRLLFLRPRLKSNQRSLFIFVLLSVVSILLLISLDVGPRPKMKYVLKCAGDDFVLLDLGQGCHMPEGMKNISNASCVIATSSRRVCNKHVQVSDTTVVWSREVVLDLQWLKYSCPMSMSSCGYWDWDNPGNRINAAVIFAVISGAVRIIVLKGHQKRLTMHISSAEDFVPVVHITGRHILNPLCKDHFSNTSLLTQNLEKVSEKLTAVTHFIPKQATPHLNKTGDFLAVGGKSFVDASSAHMSVFKRDAFWAAITGFCPGYSETEAALRESLIYQSVMWRMRRVVGIQLDGDGGLEDASVCKGQKSYGQATNNLAVALHDLTTVCNASVKECLEDILAELSTTEVGDSLECDLGMVKAFLNDLSTAAYRFPIVPKQKRFVYLMQGPGPGPNFPTDVVESSDGDVYRLSFGSDFQLEMNDIFYPKSTFNEGRNALIRMALSFEREAGYEYLVMMDDDARLEITTETPDALWDTNVTVHPYRRLESFLLHFRPALATTHFNNWHQYLNKTPTGPYTTIRHFDPCFNAYHRESVGFFLPWYETSMDSVSWWYEGNLKYFIAASIYPEDSVVHINSLKVSNSRHHTSLNKYPDQNFGLPVLTFLRNNFRTNVSHNLDQILQGEIHALTNHLTTRVRCDEAWWEFVLKVNYTSLIMNTTRLREVGKLLKPTYIVRDAVMDRLVEDQELHSFLSLWRKAPLLSYSMNKKDLI